MRTVSDMMFEISLANGRYADPRSLARFDTCVYSQSGQDGYIAEIFRRIGERDRFFVEIGTGNGIRNNTRFLLEQGWHGIWVEGNTADVEAARSTFALYISVGSLQIVNNFITSENVNDLLGLADAPAEFDFLSLDIDQNTSHVWRALRHRSRAACIEYNASIPASSALEVPYHWDRGWEGTNWFGAGLKAMQQIGAAKGMQLVGCELTGTDALFVAGATDALFCSPFTAEQHWEPARYDRRGDRGHPSPPLARMWIASKPHPDNGSA
jgi:hypothetical protein